ncbi:uracil-DNA glycosylase family protein [Cryobacterium sp. PH31-AA6]|uniref:uracil-DNA glycosylase family protein n=1 Tax=Cryobacterium sp. PH31-AA6 TaxID=3046205 RepID=UPI0024BAD47F|nr:uracil-DNA glycosylase family protein [Cryobacterium sp. PH31-AA6]MDJ0322189.1 uracil-DNA glycosylase family protein [Cryobacterium sp. PH31-AA6]
MDAFDALRQSLVDDEGNAAMRQHGWQPLYTASWSARIVVIGQAPGHRAQTSGVPWDDASGKNLVAWLGVTEEQFRNPNLFSLLPMDFYFPGTGRSGDLPPRKGFAKRWHPPLLALMPDIRLTLLIGRYAQIHYLANARQHTLTDTVRNYRRFVPERFPLVHPSPLNFRWQTRNPWFVTDVLPELRRHVSAALDHTITRDLSSQSGKNPEHPDSEWENR